MSRDDTALDIAESLYILKTFATEAKHKPKSPTFSVKLPEELVTCDLCSSIVEDLVWVIVRSLAHRSSVQCELLSDNEADETVSRHQYSNITWSSHNFFTHKVKPKTKNAVLSLIRQTPTDSSVQLTAMRHLEQINEYIRGSSKAIVVTIDMGLYRPMKHLQRTVGGRSR